MPISVRAATSTDAAEVYRLNVAFNDARATPAYIAARLADSVQVETLYVAEVDGRIVGMAGLRLLPCICDPEPYAELTELFVEDAMRRQGVGRQLVRAIEAQVRARGASRLMLLTSWHNPTAQRFYYALGYELAQLAMGRDLTGAEQVCS